MNSPKSTGIKPLDERVCVDHKTRQSKFSDGEAVECLRCYSCKYLCLFNREFVEIFPGPEFRMQIPIA